MNKKIEKQGNDDEELAFLLAELKPQYPKIQADWSRAKLYGFLLQEVGHDQKLRLAVDMLNASDTAKLTQQILKANKDLCGWTKWLTIVTGVMAAATFSMALSNYQMANTKPTEPSIGFTFDAFGEHGYPVLLRKPVFTPKENHK